MAHSIRFGNQICMALSIFGNHLWSCWEMNPANHSILRCHCYHNFPCPCRAHKSCLHHHLPSLLFWTLHHDFSPCQHCHLPFPQGTVTCCRRRHKEGGLCSISKFFLVIPHHHLFCTTTLPHGPTT